MTQKRFFSAVLVLTILITGFFYLKLKSAQAQWCQPYFNFVCDVLAQVECLGTDYVHEIRGSFCRNTNCVSAYAIYCQAEDDVIWEYKTDIECESPEHPQCGGQW